MDLQVWKQELRSTISRLEERSESLLGYPLDPSENVVTDPDEDVPAGLPADLEELYRTVGAVWLPDVGNSYYIHSPGFLAEAVARGMPVEADTDELTGRIVPFASGGDGTFYCLAADSGAVWELPEGELTKQGVYRGGMGAPRLVATGVEEFLEKLLAAARRFVETGEITSF
ncbi:hypothetical protein [Jatrophihabitans sp.]|uniref:hypothetical protein n=1 Tax=Jatrophihabitans sp. TaxID=1932789 RepID=UPI002C56BBEB|nr:hypothetical protein [Jatrophihabitans sp.]